MSSQPKRRFTPEEYLVLERKAEYKSEYLDGEILAMTGASRKHNLISTNAITALNKQLENRPCELYGSDMRVKVSQTGLYTYPDLVVVCDEPQFEDMELDTLLNPTLIIEILSKSTENYDRGEKFEHYRSIETLKEYLLIAQKKHHVMLYTRQADNNWLLSEKKSINDTISLSSINCDLLLTDVYRKVKVD
jgi:Uma2 family endonuclease